MRECVETDDIANQKKERGMKESLVLAMLATLEKSYTAATTYLLIHNSFISFNKYLASI